MSARPEDIPADTAPFYEAWADRLLWTLEAGDVAVVPGGVKEEFLDYMCHLLRLRRDSLSILPWADYDCSDWYPGHNSKLLSTLKKLVDNSKQSWCVTCYIRDRDIISWENSLGLSDSNSYAFSQNLAEFMNTKSVFRVLAKSAGIPIADGRVVTRGDELVDAIADLLQTTGAVIVKQDQNSGGDGNFVLSQDSSIQGLGARWFSLIQGSGRGAIRRALADVGLDRRYLPPSGCGPSKYIVEVFSPNSLSCFSELYIPKGSPPELRNYGEARMTPLWSGFEIPSRRLTTAQAQQLRTQSRQLASLVQSVGYIGRLDCDVIVTQAGELIFNEFNGRAGGATHIDVICRRIFGSDYLRNIVLVTSNAVSSPAFSEVIQELRAESALFTHERAAGVIVTQDNTSQTGTIEYISIGRSYEEALMFEQRLQSALGRD